MTTLTSKPQLRYLHIHPTMVKDALTIAFSLSVQSDVRISFVNLKGEIAFEKSFFNCQFLFDECLHLGDLTGGIYILSIDCGSNQKVFRKIVKL